MSRKKKAEKKYKLQYGQLYRVPIEFSYLNVAIPKPEWCTKECIQESWMNGKAAAFDVTTTKGTKLRICEDSTLMYLDTACVFSNSWFFTRGHHDTIEPWALILFGEAVYLAPMVFCLPKNKISELELRKLRNEA